MALDLQVVASSEASFPPQAVMEIHPLFDINTSKWIIDIEGETYIASSLCDSAAAITPCQHQRLLSRWVCSQS